MRVGNMFSRGYTYREKDAQCVRVQGGETSECRVDGAEILRRHRTGKASTTHTLESCPPTSLRERMADRADRHGGARRRPMRQTRGTGRYQEEERNCAAETGEERPLRRTRSSHARRRLSERGWPIGRTVTAVSVEANDAACARRLQATRAERDRCVEITTHGVLVPVGVGSRRRGGESAKSRRRWRQR